jgi:uncharacterized protein
MRVVLDTNIYISAIFWKGASYKIVGKAADGEFEAIASDEIIKELTNVLGRDFGRDKDEISEIIKSLRLFVRFVETKSKINAVKDDPADDRILECAVDSHSQYVITQDNHLLKLKNYNGVKIITPNEFLGQIA